MQSVNTGRVSTPPSLRRTGQEGWPDEPRPTLFDSDLDKWSRGLFNKISGPLSEQEMANADRWTALIIFPGELVDT